MSDDFGTFPDQDDSYTDADGVTWPDGTPSYDVDTALGDDSVGFVAPTDGDDEYLQNPYENQ